MNREELLEQVLKAIEETNKGIKIGMDAMRENSQTMQMIADELLHGAVENQYQTAHALDAFRSLPRTGVFEFDDTVDVEAEEAEAETIEEFAARVAEKIQKREHSFGDIQMVSIQLDTERFEPHAVMEIVQRILSGEKVEPQKPVKEDPDDAFNFRSLEEE